MASWPRGYYFWCKGEKAVFDVWPGGGRRRGGGGEWRQSPPVSRAKQHHGNSLMLRGDEWQPVCWAPRKGEGSPSTGQPDTADSGSTSHRFSCFVFSRLLLTQPLRCTCQGYKRGPITELSNNALSPEMLFADEGQLSRPEICTHVLLSEQARWIRTRLMSYIISHVAPLD